MPAADLKPLFLSRLVTHYRLRIESSELEEFSKRYRAVYDSYLLGGRIYEQISIKEDSPDG